MRLTYHSFYLNSYPTPAMTDFHLRKAKRRYDAFLALHDLTSESCKGLAKLFRNKLQIGEMCWSDVRPGRFAESDDFIVLEIGLLNDHEGSLVVFDQVMRDFRFSRSCGLARVFKFPDEDEYLRFMNRFQELLLVGWYAAWHRSSPDQMGAEPPTSMLHNLT